jgi:hypothetical protein
VGNGRPFVEQKFVQFGQSRPLEAPVFIDPAHVGAPFHGAVLVGRLFVLDAAAEALHVEHF